MPAWARRVLLPIALWCSKGGPADILRWCKVCFGARSVLMRKASSRCLGIQAVASLVTAAVRLGIVGAIEAQTVMTTALGIVAEVSDDLVVDDQPLRSFTPMAEIAVALHGTSGQRLFSN